MSDRTNGAIVTKGHGGWSIHFRPERTEHGSSTSTLSHYGDTWTAHLDELEPGALFVDVTVIEDGALVDLAVKGPMLDTELRPGEIRGLAGYRECDYSAPFFGARSLDYVSAIDWVELRRRAGAVVADAREHAAQLV